MKGARLAIVVGTARDLERAAGLAHAARAAGVEVAIFAMHDGVAALAAAPDMVTGLLEADCDVVACGTSADERRLLQADVGAGVTLGSQDDHAAIVHRADRVVSFT